MIGFNALTVQLSKLYPCENGLTNDIRKETMNLKVTLTVLRQAAIKYIRRSMADTKP
jgi:hypothetical protein